MFLKTKISFCPFFCLFIFSQLAYSTIHKMLNFNDHISIIFIMFTNPIGSLLKLLTFCYILPIQICEVLEHLFWWSNFSTIFSSVNWNFELGLVWIPRKLSWCWLFWICFCIFGYATKLGRLSVSIFTCGFSNPDAYIIKWNCTVFTNSWWWVVEGWDSLSGFEIWLASI